MGAKHPAAREIVLQQNSWRFWLDYISLNLNKFDSTCLDTAFNMQKMTMFQTSTRGVFTQVWLEKKGIHFPRVRFVEYNQATC